MANDDKLQEIWQGKRRERNGMDIRGSTALLKFLLQSQITSVQVGQVINISWRRVNCGIPKLLNYRQREE